MDDESAYSKQSLDELHDRINKILAQLPEITGRADSYSRAAVFASKLGKSLCESGEEIASLDGHPHRHNSGSKSRKTSTANEDQPRQEKILESFDERSESPTKELILSGRRGRNKMYKKRARSSRKLKRSQTDVEELQQEVTSFCDANSEPVGSGSLPMEQVVDHQKLASVENLQSSLAHSLKKLQKLNLNIPKLDTTEVSCGPLEKSKTVLKSQTIQGEDSFELESSEESLDDNDAYLNATPKPVPKNIKNLRDNYSNRKVSGLTESSIDENEEFETTRNFSANLSERKICESATEQKCLNVRTYFRDALNESLVSELSQSLDESMAKNTKDSSPLTLFTSFITSSELKEIMINFRLLCKVLKIQTSFCRFRTFRLIQSNLANAELWPKLWKCLNEKSKMTIYGKQAVCMNKNVLVIGAGPCGLRAAIECALLGARVVLIEKRPDFSRTNCVYLWSFVIEDLISLGANHVGGRFSTSRNSDSTDNVYPIATIQLALTKIALLLGVTIITSCEFLDIIYPSSEFDSYRVLSKIYKHSQFSTYEDFKLQNYFFRTLICASGQSIAVPELFSEKSNAKKSNTAGFGITANFLKPNKGSDWGSKQEDKIGGLKRSNSTFLASSSNKNDTERDRPLASCRSSSKVDQSLRAELMKDHGSKNEASAQTARQSSNANQKTGYTHNFKMAIEKGFFHQTVMHYDLDKLYFIMTVNASVLKNCGAIYQNFEDDKNKTMSLHNINIDVMTDYITTAANYATHGRYYPLEFALNKKGEPDFSLFYSSPNITANHAGKIIDRFGQKLLVMLVGDSLIHPFWKTGSGLAKGFMSVLDAAWVLRTWAEDSGKPLSLLALQESLYLFLKDLKSSAIKSFDCSFSIDPSTRYKSLASLPIVKMDAVKALLDVEEIGLAAQKGSRVVLPKLHQRKGQSKGAYMESDFSIFNLLKKLKPPLAD